MSDILFGTPANNIRRNPASPLEHGNVTAGQGGKEASKGALVKSLVEESNQSANLRSKDENSGARKLEEKLQEKEKEKEPDVKSLQNAVDKMNNSLQQATGLRFNLDEDAGKTVVTVIDSKSKETIRQIPSEEMLELSRRMKDLRGVLFNEEA